MKTLNYLRYSLRGNQKLLIFGFLLLQAGTFTSCKKLVEVNAPTNQLVTKTVFNNNGNAITAQLGVYAQMESNLCSIVNINTCLSSDELSTYATDQKLLDLYYNSLNATDDAAGVGCWGIAYFLIYQENAIIENVSASKGMSEAVKNELTGEAEFIRAYCYFNLVNLYGNVPLVTTTDYKLSTNLARSPQAQIYQQMVTDLQSAQKLLSSSYLDASNSPGTTDRVRPTVWAADALLARVYLYMGNHYKEAVDAATFVINNSSMFSLLTDLNQVFKKNSNEAIFQLTPPAGTNYTPEGVTFVLLSPPPSNTGTPHAISSQLLNAFEPNDSRKTNWIGTYTNNGSTWYFPYKYKNGQNSTSLTEYSMVLRLAEQYLIRAEALAQQNNISGAITDLNAIRNRAGLPNYTGAQDLNSVLAAIDHERQVELFTENDRWYNLKRRVTINDVMSVVTPQKGGTTWQPYQALYPISPTNLLLAPNLKQNPVY